MKEKFIAIILMMDRLALEMRTRALAIAKTDPGFEDFMIEAVALNEGLKYMCGAANLTPDERAACLINAGWPRDEVEALLAVALAQEGLSSVLAKKRDSETLN